MVHDIVAQAAYMAHGYCLLWKPWLVTLHAGSDFLIFAAYVAIPIGIWIFLQKRKEAPLRPIAWLFVAFILLCGLTHIVNLITLWWPIYETQGWIKLATAIVSVATAVAVFVLIPKALAIPSPAALEAANASLREEISAHQRTLAQLEAAKADLDKRYVAQAASLSQAHALLEVISETTPTLLYAKDQDGKLRFASRALLRYLDKTEEETLGKTELDYLASADQARAIMETDERIRASGQGETLEEIVDDGAGAQSVFLSAKAPYRDDTGKVVGLVGVSVDVTERKRAEERVKLLMGELAHRGKNQMAVLTYLVRQSLRDGVDVTAAREALLGRMEALSASMQLVSGGVGLRLSLRDIFDNELDLADARLQVQGPELYLNPHAAQTFSLLVHELRTNAVKHGALSVATGRINATWAIDAGRLSFSWAERGGPPTSPPQSSGFGEKVIRALVEADFSTSVKTEYGEHGFSYSFDADLDLIADK